MLLRRNTAPALGTLVLAVTALSSCGFDYATDQINTIATVENNRSEEVDVVGAVIVSEAPGAGTFYATLSGSGLGEPTAFDTLDGETIDADFEPYDVPPDGAAVLFQEGGVTVRGDFTAGDFVPMVAGFENGTRVELLVPIVPACDQYEGLDDATLEEDPALVKDQAPYECQSIFREPDAETEAEEQLSGEDDVE